MRRALQLCQQLLAVAARLRHAAGDLVAAGRIAECLVRKLDGGKQLRLPAGILIAMDEVLDGLAVADQLHGGVEGGAIDAVLGGDGEPDAAFQQAEPVDAGQCVAKQRFRLARRQDELRLAQLHDHRGAAAALAFIVLLLVPGQHIDLVMQPGEEDEQIAAHDQRPRQQWAGCDMLGQRGALARVELAGEIVVDLDIARDKGRPLQRTIDERKKRVELPGRVHQRAPG